MFAKRRKINLGGGVFTTPILIPSFSSKGFPDVEKILKTTEETITESILVSAYDIYHKFVSDRLEFPELIFLDSGGYEASRDVDFSELGYSEYVPGEWSADNHLSVIDKWDSDVPTVFISFDHPKQRCSIEEQIKRAKQLFNGRNCGKELLIKPETSTQTNIKIESILDNIKLLHGFDVIGFTEKELGKSILDRMINIARVRKAMNGIGLSSTPIHIFGSLDTVTTPLYFISGADIFDGLTWLRFAYHEGMTIYTHNFAALKYGLQTKDQLAIGQIWFSNYYSLRELELSMKRFLNEGKFGEFKYHSSFFEESYQALIAKMED